MKVPEWRSGTARGKPSGRPSALRANDVASRSVAFAPVITPAMVARSRFGRRSPLVARRQPPGLDRRSRRPGRPRRRPRRRVRPAGRRDRRRRRSAAATPGSTTTSSSSAAGDGRAGRDRAPTDGVIRALDARRPRARARGVGARRGRVRDRARRRVRCRRRAPRRERVAGSGVRPPTTRGTRRGRPTARGSRGTSGTCPTCRGTRRASSCATTRAPRRSSPVATRSASVNPGSRPTGERLAFVSDADGWPVVWTADPDGGNAQPVLREDHEHAEPAWGPGQRSYAWSPDGDADRVVPQRGRLRSARDRCAGHALGARAVEGLAPRTRLERRAASCACGPAR